MVKVSVVPQIDGLTVDDFLKHARTNPTILKHLPDERDWFHLDKKWLCDVMYTIDTPGTQAMVDIALKARRQKLEKSQSQIVEMRPEFASALKNALSFSSKRSSHSTRL